MHFPRTPHVYLAAPEGVDPLTQWVFTEDATQDLAQLKLNDNYAWKRLIALLHRFGADGASSVDSLSDHMRAPIGHRVKARLNGPAPWLGELRVEGQPRSRRGRLDDVPQYRVHFGDIADAAGSPPLRMLVASVTEKRTTTSFVGQR